MGGAAAAEWGRAVLVSVALLCVACARSDERWLVELEHPDAFVRAMAAIAIAEQAPARGAGAVRVLFETIDRPGVGLRDEAQRALARIGPFAAEPLVAALLEDELMSAERRRAILAALASGGPRSVPAIVTALGGPEHPSARDLGETLLRIGEPAVEPLAALFTGTQREDLRDYVVWLLGRMGGRARAAVPALRDALPGASPELGAAISDALRRITGGR